jgi:hypothetical protein
MGIPLSFILRSFSLVFEDKDEDKGDENNLFDH